MSDLFDVRRKVALITGAPGAFGAVAARVVAGYTACCASQGGGGRDDPGAGLRVADSLRLMGVAADGIVPRIAVVEGIAAAVGEAGFVFEAAPEKMALKQAIFAEVEASAPAMALLCSNSAVNADHRDHGGAAGQNARQTHPRRRWLW